MTTPRLYSDLAYLWPMLSPPEHYAAEAAVLMELIDQHFTVEPGGKLSLLELGVGGGHTLVHMAEHFDCTAVDLSDAMLDNCRRLVPQVKTIVGDMRSIRLGRTFDVVFIHDAIDYMLSEDDARKAIQTVTEHLKPGGLCAIAPTYTRETFVDGDVADDGTTTDSEELTYFTFVHDSDPADDTFEMILLYLIRDMQTRKVEVIEDRHTCGLFSSEQWLAWLRDAGLKAQHVQGDLGEDEPWELFVGVKK